MRASSKMKKNKGLLIKGGVVAVALSTFVLGGCVSSVPELTEEQSAQVSEYATGLLLKYDKNSQNRLVVEEEPVPEPATQQEQEAPAQDAEKETGVPEGTEVVDNTQSAEAVQNQMSVQEYLNIENFDIQYSGYEVKDRYPEAGESELYMAMGATSGNKLLVLQFTATNTGGADAELDTLSQNVKYKVAVNGDTEKYALTTMLLDDLASFKGTIPAGGTQNLVLIVEIPEDKAASVETISLKMKGKGTDVQQTLK